MGKKVSCLFCGKNDSFAKDLKNRGIGKNKRTHNTTAIPPVVVEGGSAISNLLIADPPPLPALILETEARDGPGPGADETVLVGLLIQDVFHLRVELQTSLVAQGMFVMEDDIRFRGTVKSEWA